jgi:DNA polymerase elongation subunit (family B)
MLNATKYCIIDAKRCQELLVKKQIINEQYNMAHMTGITLKQAFTRANGFKVFNYLVNEGIKENYSFIYNRLERETAETEYAGGYVAEPVYGLNLECPVIGLDFASLYPNIQRTLNLGPDTIIRKEEIEKYKKDEVKIREINGKYIIDHNEEERNKSIMVKILTNLFNQRVIIKKKMLEYKSQKENGKYDEKEYDEINYIINDLDQKQKTIKVLMNSFYGLLGSETSPIYCKYIAETITKR